MSMTSSYPGSTPTVRRVALQAIRDSDRDQATTSRINVGQVERWASGVGGGLLIVHGLRKGTFGGLALSLLGAALAYRGATGHCQAYQALDIDTSGKHRADDSEAVFKGVLVKHSTVINRTPAEIYEFLKVPGNHQRTGDYVESVTLTPEGNWHWVMKGPFGATIRFDSHLINDKPGELIAWKTLPGADLPNAGSIRLAPAWDGRGTEVTQEMNYEPPAGIVGATIAKLFPQDPEKIVRENLRHLKQILEAGEIPTTHGQPVGHSQGRA